MAGVKVTRCLLVVAVTSLALIAFGSNVRDGFAGVDVIHSARHWRPITARTA